MVVCIIQGEWGLGLFMKIKKEMNNVESGEVYELGKESSLKFRLS